jgi:hypothetical protein
MTTDRVFWQMAVRSPPGMEEARYWTRPDLRFLCGAPAGIEPATPSLPWNHWEPLCGSPFSQVRLDRWCQSYGFSFSEGMRSLSGRTLAGAPPRKSPRSRIEWPIGSWTTWDGQEPDRPCDVCLSYTDIDLGTRGRAIGLLARVLYPDLPPDPAQGDEKPDR